MDLYEKDRTITLAMALALMRQAHELLQSAKEEHTAAQLQLAVDALLRVPRIPSGSVADAD
ncbi:MAG: hypothetical protein B7Z36_04890 [Novosphingobium sp. 12-63-9]|nr:MAG: hypothetical protein B7Z36_04890 [Novosphingobium sp. 12-63-9]